MKHFSFPWNTGLTAKYAKYANPECFRGMVWIFAYLAYFAVQEIFYLNRRAQRKQCSCPFLRLPKLIGLCEITANAIPNSGLDPFTPSRFVRRTGGRNAIES
jgi:hypothetical protein